MLKTMSLKDQNYETTEGECPDCEDGTLWVNQHELVCEECFHVFRDDGQHPRGDVNTVEPPAVSFYENRSEHTYDTGNPDMSGGTIRMPGGFVEPYEGDGLYGDGRSEDDLPEGQRGT